MKANFEGRPLGSVEKVFWLLDQVSQVHFVMAVELEGYLTADELRKGLNAVQERHPLFSVSINANGYEHPMYEHDEGKLIPLRVVQNIVTDQIDIEMSRELATPFDWTGGPLIRVVLIEDQKKPTIVFAVYHAISDGVSMMFVIRDLLQALNGQTLQSLAVPFSTDELLSLPINRFKNNQSKANVSGQARRKERQPQVNRIKLSAQITSQLVETARKEGTTVQGALYAAFIKAARQTEINWSNKNIRVVVPISVRNSIGAGESSCLYINSKVISHQPDDFSAFWDLARYAKKELNDVQFLETIKSNTEGLQNKVFSDINVSVLSEVLQKGVGREMMISNLGRFPYQTNFGKLKIKSMWGPLALSGTQDEQTVGVITTDNRLCLSTVSRNPATPLLKLVKQALKSACEISESVD
jgi:NRPS condensation-like uncharacterized protein